MRKQHTAIIEREGNGYVSLCPELDIASQGDTIKEAHKNLREALALFLKQHRLRKSKRACPKKYT
jgi:predicted RNase H-like HicB family nuclease